MRRHPLRKGMRQLVVQVPRGRGDEVMAMARRCDGRNLHRAEAESPEGPVDVVLVNLPNRGMERLMAELDGLDGVHVTFAPGGVIALHPPDDEAPEQAMDVEPRSPIEVFLGGLQSVGSWKSLLGYAAAAGVVVWIGLFTGTVYLLVAAMLIAPFAGPAMNAGVASARGDWSLLGRSLARYFASLAATALAALLLSLALGQRAATPLMVEVSQVSSVAVLLPLVAGAAGALHLVQSERSSLVSGAAVGILVAASLAPPAGLIGMALALGAWEMLRAAVFVVLLQLAGIHLSGAVVFRLYGLGPQGPRYPRGSARAGAVSLILAALAVGALLAFQFAQVPDLQRAMLAQRAATEAREAVEESGLAHVVDASARFTDGGTTGQETLLVVLYVQPAEGVDLPDEEVAARLRVAVGERLAEGYGATPLVAVHVLEPVRSGGA